MQEQEARAVISGGFVFENSRFLLASRTENGPHKKGLGNSRGQVGRYILGHGDVRICGSFDDTVINGYIGPGSAAMRIDDFNGNNFDHSGLGFIRGGTMGTSGSGMPVERVNVIPPDVPRWGRGHKEFFARCYTRTWDINSQPETLLHRDNTIDLDPCRRDGKGLPLPRVTFSFHQNETRLHRFMGQVGERIMREAGASKVWSELPGKAPSRWAGGTRMGKDPKKSVVDENYQVHEAPNLFIIGSSVFPTMAGYPPLATVSALSYRAADYIIRQKDWFQWADFGGRILDRGGIRKCLTY